MKRKSCKLFQLKHEVVDDRDDIYPIGTVHTSRTTNYGQSLLDFISKHLLKHKHTHLCCLCLFLHYFIYVLLVSIFVFVTN
jgi:hypothetical protein